jgi:hypothetical protein
MLEKGTGTDQDFDGVSKKVELFPQNERPLIATSKEAWKQFQKIPRRL